MLWHCFAFGTVRLCPDSGVAVPVNQTRFATGGIMQPKYWAYVDMIKNYTHPILQPIVDRHVLYDVIEAMQLDAGIFQFSAILLSMNDYDTESQLFTNRPARIGKTDVLRN